MSTGSSDLEDDPGFRLAAIEILRGGTRSTVGAALRLKQATVMKITAPTDAARSITMCMCLKCGSTSIFASLYQKLNGRPFIIQDSPPYVQDFGSWHHPLVTFTTDPGSVANFQIVRDPIERYVSAFADKVQCCLVACDKGFESIFLVQSLLSLNGLRNASKACFTFDEFVHQLVLARESGRDPFLNFHWLPQSMMCPHFNDTVSCILSA